MFAALDEKIRAEAEAKMKAIRLVATAHRTVTETREEFARKDAENVAELTSALAEASKAGFRDSDLKQWKLADRERRGPQKATRGRKRASEGTSAETSSTAAHSAHETGAGASN